MQLQENSAYSRTVLEPAAVLAPSHLPPPICSKPLSLSGRESDFFFQVIFKAVDHLPNIAKIVDIQTSIDPSTLLIQGA